MKRLRVWTLFWLCIFALSFAKEDNFTINYTNVPIQEYLRFVSKITNKNFIYSVKEEDLTFTVTVISEDPLTPENVMATLVQVLRINGFKVMEEEDNFVIHKSEEVSQIAKLVLEGEPIDQNYPLITKVYRLKQAKASAISAVIKPMLSASSLIEVFDVTNQIILTDITSNIEKISLLIENLDSVQTSIAIEPYHVQYEEADTLISLAYKILEPITRGYPFLLVSQPSTQVIFVVSTSPFIEKAIAVLSTLDAEARDPKAKSLKADNIFIYAVKHRTPIEIQQVLQEIGQKIEASGYAEKGFLETIETAKVIPESGTLLFLGSASSLAKIKELVNILDTINPGSESPADSFFVYKPKYVTASQIGTSIEEITTTLEDSPLKDHDLLETLKKAKVVSSTQSIIFSGDPATFPKVRELLSSIDDPGFAESEGKNSFYIYQLQNVSADTLSDSLKNFAKELEKGDAKDKSLIQTIQSMKYFPETRSLLFTGTERSLKKLQEILPSFDESFSKGSYSSRSQFYVYKPKYKSGPEIVEAMKDLLKNLKQANLSDPYLIQSLESMHWVEKTHSLIFTGNEESLNKVEALLQTIDTTSSAVSGLKKTFFIYQLKYVPKENAEEYLNKVANNLDSKSLKEEGLIEAIHSMKWIAESHSFMFFGTQDSLDRIHELLLSFDGASDKAFPGGKPRFLLYTLKYAPKEKLESYLKEVASHLDQSDPEQSHLYKTIQSRKWVEESHSFMFLGNETSLNKIEELVSNFDHSYEKNAKEKASFFLYALKHVSQQQMDAYLSTLADNLKSSEVGQQDLIRTIEQRKWIEHSHSFMFSGPEYVLEKVKPLLIEFDDPSDAKVAQTYYLYKLLYVSGEVIEEHLERFAKNMKASGMGNNSVIQVIDNIKWIQETNSLLLTGDAKAIEEVKVLISEQDNPGRQAALHKDFFMYKPHYISAQQLKKSLHDVAQSLKRGGLVDEELLRTIESMRYSAETQSLLFTGTPASLQKTEGLIKEIDIPTGEDARPASGFLIYKLKFTSGPKMISYLKDIAEDLIQSGSSDSSFLSALNSVRFIEETQSLIFTGSDPVLQRVKDLVEKFDIPSLSDTPSTNEAPSSFFVYKPSYVPGPQLLEFLRDFVHHLKEQKMYDPDLYQTIDTAKWIDSSSSLVFTGTQSSIDRVKELLQLFDTPTKGFSLENEGIQSIENVSFLVYKLQYHKGSEIQQVLKQIAKDITQNNSPVSKDLLNSIQSIQWLEVTNSLLCTGNQETLTRLKELIKNLDIPLKQVFIEVLMIETSLSNILNFGLDWTGNLKYQDRFAGRMQNTNSKPSSASSSFFDSVNALNGSTNPSPTSIPKSSNFELGVIGDIIFHKGQSFLSMGSLLNALQQDSETSIVMTPKILTQDNKQSHIFVGRNIPYAGSFVTNNTGSGSTVTNQNIEYRDVGMDLTITPVLGSSDIITLDISLDKSSDLTNDGSSVNSSNIIPSTGTNGITTSRASMSTTVHVPNESFLVLSGMVDMSHQRSKQGIPCLGGLPWLGAAFSLSQNADNRANLVIFIRPHIISSYDEIKRLTEDQENFFREQAGTSALEYDFEEGMEFIKGVDDE